MKDKTWDPVKTLLDMQNVAYQVAMETGRSESATKIKELEHDIMVLVGRLYGEDRDTFAPETIGVMDKWSDKFEKMLSDGNRP